MAECPEAYLAIEHHRNAAGQRMTFQGRSWLIPIYADKNPNQVFMKCVQCGITELLIIRMLQRCREVRSVLYILPSLEIRNKFVANRIDRMVEGVPFYMAGIGRTDNTGLKAFWGGICNFVGSNVPGAFREFPAIDIIIDEFDLCDQDNLVYAQDRIAAAVQLGFTPTITIVSNPTVVKGGIDIKYEDSDKKSWQIKCEHCGLWQPLDWFANVINKDTSLPFGAGTGGLSVVCRSCHKPIDRLGPGQWVAEHPGHAVSGYHISKLFTGQTTLEELYAKYQRGRLNETENQQFFNSELGLPYAGAGECLTYETFHKCALPGYQLPLTAAECVAGVDVGNVLHVRIDALVDGNRKMVFAGIVPDYDELDVLLKRYNVRLFVMDARPETHKTPEFISTRRGGFQCEFYTDNSTKEQKLDSSTRMIKVDRTRSLDEATEAYLRCQVILPENWRSLDSGQWVTQMMAPVRSLDLKRKPPAYVWDEKGQADHHRFADNYCHIAAKMCGFGKRSMEVKWI